MKNKSCSTLKPLRVALVLRGRQFIRSWFESGLVGHLRNSDIEVVVFADSETRSAMSIKERDGVIEIENEANDWMLTHLVFVTTAELRKKSSTHQFKLRRQLLSDYWVLPRTGTTLEKIVGCIYGIGRVLRSTRRNFWSLIYEVPLARLIVKKMAGLRSSAFNDALPDFSNFDWLIVPSAGVGSETDLLDAADRAGTRSIVVIDNWDHLTAKGSFIVKPNFLTVMGALYSRYAVELHSLDNDKVLEFGLPRFDIYRDGRHSLMRFERIAKPRILYVGWSLPHSEERIVSYLSRSLESRFGVGYFEFVYRPHPKKPLVKDPFKFTTENITIHDFGQHLRTDMPKMDEAFVSELIAADVVVGPPTTMMLEAAILGRPCVLDLTVDDFHRTSSGNFGKWCLHLQDLINVSTIDKANDMSELVALVERYLQDRIPTIRHDVSHLYNSNDKSFRDLLADFLVNN